jgi:hypothetical protein
MSMVWSSTGMGRPGRDKLSKKETSVGVQDQTKCPMPKPSRRDHPKPSKKEIRNRKKSLADEDRDIGRAKPSSTVRQRDRS